MITTLTWVRLSTIRGSEVVIFLPGKVVWYRPNSLRTSERESGGYTGAGIPSL